MAASGGTPQEYGLKVQSHSTLLVTSPLKMRTARDLELSFSGQLLQTIIFYKDTNKLKANFELLQKLILRLPKPNPVTELIRSNSRTQWAGTYRWSDVPASEVTSFLRSYSSHPNARRVNSGLMADFIESLNQEGELTSWSIALIGAVGGEPHPLPNEVIGALIKRSNEAAEISDHYSIGTLTSPRDEAIALSPDEWEAAMKKTRESWRADPGRRKSKEEPDAPSGPAIRHILGFGAPGVPQRRDRGFLALYLVDPNSKASKLPQGTPPILAFGIAFPASTSGRKVTYKANNILWEQDYGPSE